MARVTIQAGSTIDLSNISLPKSITEYDKLYIYIYTSQSNIVKFAYPEKTGYNSITVKEDDTNITFKVLSKQTAKFDGALYFLIKLIDDGEVLTEDDAVGAKDLGIDIINNYIKNES